MPQKHFVTTLSIYNSINKKTVIYAMKDCFMEKMTGFEISSSYYLFKSV